MKIYDVKLNDEGQKVCVIDGIERKVLESSDSTITVDYGNGKTKVLNLYGDKDRDFHAMSSDEGDVMLSYDNKSVVFTRNAPAKKAIGDNSNIIRYQVVATPKKIKKFDRYAPIRQGSDMYDVTESKEGTAVLTQIKNSGEKNSENLTNATGHDLLQEDDELGEVVSERAGLFASIDEKTPIPPIGGPRRTGRNEERVDPVPKEKKPSKIRKRIIPILVGVPLVLPIFLKSCGKDIEPKPDPDPDLIGMIHEVPDPDPNPSDIIPGKILESLDNFDTLLPNVIGDIYSESEAIVYDIEEYDSENFDENLKKIFGNDFAGLRTDDGVPSSFNKKLNETYGMSEEELELVNTVHYIVGVSRMDTNQMKDELNKKGLNVTKSNSNLWELNAMATLIENETGLDIFDQNGSDEILEKLEEYSKLQVEYMEKYIEFSEIHKDLTEKNISKRPNQEAKDSYEHEFKGHSASLDGKNLQCENFKKQQELMNDLRTGVKTIVITAKLAPNKNNTITQSTTAPINNGPTQPNNGITHTTVSTDDGRE